MKKFLVVDDSEDRKESYRMLFNFIELDFAFTKKDFMNKIKQKYDGYILDIIYEYTKFEDYSFQQILENIPPKKPFFVISNKWSTAMDEMKMKYIRSSGKHNDVLGYFSWGKINEDGQQEYARDFVREQISHYFDLAYGAFEDDQSITILQISDVEFGNPDQKQNVETERANIINKVRENLRRLDVNSSNVDFICICGDIAHKGEKAEYAKAKKWLKQLGNTLLSNQNFENMLIVPGNHDYSYNASAGNFYQYKNGTYEQRENSEKLEFHEQGMYNFAKFVYELNGDISYLKNPYKPIINRTYENYGINFILLNPVRTNFEKKFVFGLNDKNMEYLIEKSEEIDKSVCNIVLSHIAPDKYSMLDPSSDATNRNIKSIVDSLQVKVWFYGHAHEDEKIDDRKIGRNKVLMSRTQSLMLNNSQHCEDSGNGFSLFKLERKGGKVVNIHHYNESVSKIESYKMVFDQYL